MRKSFIAIILILLDTLTLGIIFSTLPANIEAVLITLLLLYSEKIYTLHYDFWQEMKKILKALLLSYLIILSFLVFSDKLVQNQAYSIALYFLLLSVVLPIQKRIAKRLLYAISLFKTDVLLLGKKEEIDIFKRELKENWYLGLQPNKQHYSTVIIASKGMKLKDIDKLISQYLTTNTTLHVVPYLRDINFSNATIIEYSNIRYNTIQIENRLLMKRNIFIKNFFDYLFGILLLPIFLLLHLVLSLLIRLDSKGDILFRQQRLAKDGKIFVCYKYRTMYEDSEILLQNYLKEHSEEIDYYKKYHKYKNDPRVTRVGKFLRRTSLDELAQIINILKGEMSFVGPRPYMLNESEALGKSKEFILKVKPGITGLWQVSGRNNIPFKERIKLETWYIKNWSLWADFIIVIKTIKVVFMKVGAK
ncbi:MAG TPA: exopolysaccharide biosynthesis polyprenyl glycosylphosphotransferase [Sulfurimonas autotrophica]|nr:exopolysaccharide biosynthesis polyprenyl glycosylphosphotransferase [Sulfurimonas autotrophica]